jgi:hypothetical protein
VRLITTHLKSKLLTFPGGRYIPHDEGERARYVGDRCPYAATQGNLTQFDPAGLSCLRSLRGAHRGTFRENLRWRWHERGSGAVLLVAGHRHLVAPLLIEAEGIL